MVSAAEATVLPVADAASAALAASVAEELPVAAPPTVDAVVAPVTYQTSPLAWCAVTSGYVPPLTAAELLVVVTGSVEDVVDVVPAVLAAVVPAASAALYCVCASVTASCACWYCCSVSVPC